MNIEDFNKLKLNDLVYLPDNHRKGEYIGTQVLKLDHYFKKLTVLLGRKSYSYKYIKKKLDKNQKTSCLVGKA